MTHPEQISFAAMVLASFLTVSTALAQPKGGPEYLPVCIKCLNPRITAKTGFGTENAVAEAKVVAEDARVWCAANRPRDPYCAVEEVKIGGDGARASYRASANCLTGQMKSMNSGDYDYAGTWTEGPGMGKPRIKDPGGNIPRWESIVSGTGKARGEWDRFGGYSLSGQWTALCGTTVPAVKPQPPVQSAAMQPRQPQQQQVAIRPPATQATPPVCGGQPRCVEVNAFAVTMTDFRTSNVSRYKVATMSLRFQNKLSRPIILGYVNGSGLTTDDHGNRYTVQPASVRGIGGIANGQVDPKFLIRPGETGDASFEMVWGWSGREIFGLNFITELTVRELRPLPSGQFRLGDEFPLRFEGLSNNSVRPGLAQPSAPVISSVAPPQEQQPGQTVITPTATAPVPAPGPDPCIGIPRCFNAGPFLAEVQQVASSVAGGRHHVLRFNIRFRSLTNQPVILAATHGSSVVVDNQGNRYGITPDQAVSGMGTVRGAQADPQFVLAPGQTRNAAFQLYRRNSGQPTGTAYTLDFSLEQLEILESRQIRSIRQFALNFPDLRVSAMLGAGGAPAPGSSVENLNEAGKKIVDVFRGKKK